MTSTISHILLSWVNRVVMAQTSIQILLLLVATDTIIGSPTIIFRYWCNHLTLICLTSLVLVRYVVLWSGVAGLEMMNVG